MVNWEDVAGEYYVYIWCERKNDEILPFYVGISRTKNRWKNRSSRSNAFKEYIKDRDVFSRKVIEGVCWRLAEECEKRLQEEIKSRGFITVDAEYDKAERNKRREAGIAAMPIVDGKRVSSRTGKGFGRESRGIDISEYRVRVEAGDMTVVDACKELDISRQTWYRLVKIA